MSIMDKQAWPARSSSADRYADEAFDPAAEDQPMRAFQSRALILAAFSCAVVSCSGSDRPGDVDSTFEPFRVVDLGALVTEDLPEQVWGRAFLDQMGFDRGNSFGVISWTFPMEGVDVSGSNAYYTLFNHGGPHVDAPNHIGVGEGLDSYPVEAFSGHVKVFDVSGYSPGRSVLVDVFEGEVEAGEIVLIHTGYTPPPTDEALPEVVTLASDAAEYLATLPVRAYGTDAFSVESLDDMRMPSIHHSFLTRGIPVYEQLFNVGELLDEERMFFVGLPLNIEDGDGMIVRPVVFVY